MLRLSALPLLAALLAGCLPELPQKSPYLVEPPPPPTDIREVPHTFALGMISGRKARGVSMEVFNTGIVRVRGEAVSAMKSYHAKLRLPVPAFLIRHSEAGLILVGTGLSPDKARRPESALAAITPYSFRYRQRRGRDIVSRLKAAGVDPALVGLVVLTHWGPETAGMADAFPGAEVVVSRAEWDWRKAREAEGAPGPLPPSDFEKRLKLRFVDVHNAPAFGAFDNGHDLLGDGSVFLVSLPGRSPGAIGVWANLDGGPALLAGGAAFVVDNVLDLSLPVKDAISDLEEYWRSLHILKRMRESVPRLVVVPAHDLSPLRLALRKDIPVHE